MPLVVSQTRKVRDILKSPASMWVDLLVLVVFAALAGSLFSFGKQVAAPFHEKTIISLSFWALPKYTMFSLARGVAAYCLSLIFTLVYGTVAANNRRAEKVMVPALDVLQSIPVLAFLPGLVLAMIGLFPTREIGLEIACVIMIFTAQAWNMTFSFFASVRAIPNHFREVAKVNHLSRWRIFSLLELPASMIGLVWNSMMSMAGGWFFLTVNEAFTLGDKDFRLPGIGSYMAQAIYDGNTRAMVAAVIAMSIMIVAVDQLFWRPVVVWSERFKVEETAEADAAQSWVLNLLRRSSFYHWLVEWSTKRRQNRVKTAGKTRSLASSSMSSDSGAGKFISSALKWLVLAAILLGACRGMWSLIRLLKELPLHGAASHEDWAHVLMALGASFLRTSAAVVGGGIWALPAGILIGLSPKWSQRLQPIVQVVASFPAPMLFPLVTMLLVYLHIPFGIGCVSLMLLGTQWYVLFNVIAGAMAIPTEMKEVGSVYRTPWWRRWLRIYIPGVFPYLVTGLITAAGGAWNATIVSEYVQVKDVTHTAFGLGSQISIATAEGNFPMLAAAVVTMAISVVLINRFMWRRLYRVAESRYALNV